MIFLKILFKNDKLIDNNYQLKMAIPDNIYPEKIEDNCDNIISYIVIIFCSILVFIPLITLMVTILLCIFIIINIITCFIPTIFIFVSIRKKNKNNYYEVDIEQEV